MKKLLYTAAVVAAVALGTLGVAFGFATGAEATTGNCIGGNATKVENPGDEYTFHADSGAVVTEVAIKAGTPCYYATGDGTINDCYTITGIGTDAVTVHRIGDGPDCKDISHLEFVVESHGTTTGCQAVDPERDCPTTTQETTQETTTGETVTEPPHSTSTATVTVPGDVPPAVTNVVTTTRTETVTLPAVTLPAVTLPAVTEPAKTVTNTQTVTGPTHTVTVTKTKTITHTRVVKVKPKAHKPKRRHSPRFTG